jgi:hypothetical protein
MIFFISSGLVLWCFFIYHVFLWRYWLEKFTKDRHDFSEAVKAFKEGKSIHRNENYPTFYTSREITEDGKTTREYGYRRRDGSFSQSISFSIEEVFAEDWIIEEKK